MASDVTHYTQRPDVQKVYTTQEIADILDTTMNDIGRMVCYYKIPHEIIKTKRSRQIILDYDAYRRVKDLFEEKIRKREEAAKRAEIRKQIAEKETTEAAELHPLVTNKDFLKLSVWPDVVPDCFKECEE